MATKRRVPGFIELQESNVLVVDVDSVNRSDRRNSVVLHHLALFSQVVVFREQSLGFIVDKVTKHLKRVLLFDLFSLKEFGNLSYPLSDVLQFKTLLMTIFLEAAYFVESFLHLTIAFLDLLLLIIDEFHEVASFTD